MLEIDQQARRFTVQEAAELYEVARDFYAVAADGTVCYFGEDVDFYENGVVANHDGTWRAGVDDALPGIIMPGTPAAMRPMTSAARAASRSSARVSSSSS